MENGLYHALYIDLTIMNIAQNFFIILGNFVAMLTCQLMHPCACVCSIMQLLGPPKIATDCLWPWINSDNTIYL